MVRTQFPPALSTATEIGGKGATVVCAVPDITEKWLQRKRKRYGLIVPRHNQACTEPTEKRGNLMFPFLVPSTVHKKLA